MQVKATRVGYYGHRRQREGEVFTIESEVDFSNRWMEPIDWEPKNKKSETKKAQKPAVAIAAPKPTQSSQEVI